jgi:DnaK suppressor protein
MEKCKAVTGEFTKMNEGFVEEMRALIRARLDELTQEDARGAQGQATVELDQQAVGRLSRMDALQNQAMARANAARRGAERQRLQTALARIEEGEYGYCEDCGAEIAGGRLRLDPCALRCVDCARG